MEESLEICEVGVMGYLNLWSVLSWVWSKEEKERFVIKLIMMKMAILHAVQYMQQHEFNVNDWKVHKIDYQVESSPYPVEH